jgi:predicted DNA-binding protein (MmcQ/YjbR family)
VANDLHETVRTACLWLPESEEFVSHGSPNFRVRGRTSATYVVNHHGDGRVALWLPAAPGAQEHHVRGDPDHFFVPPYVGPRGWVGVRLDRKLKWTRIAALVREAYEHVAPDRQNLLTADPRFRIPPYFGHNGWISLDVSQHGHRIEIEALARQSYRHFALERMLKKLPPDAERER